MSSFVRRLILPPTDPLRGFYSSYKRVIIPAFFLHHPRRFIPWKASVSCRATWLVDKDDGDIRTTEKLHPLSSMFKEAGVNRHRHAPYHHYALPPRSPNPNKDVAIQKVIRLQIIFMMKLKCRCRLLTGSSWTSLNSQYDASLRNNSVLISVVLKDRGAILFNNSNCKCSQGRISIGTWRKTSKAQLVWKMCPSLGLMAQHKKNITR